MQLGNGKWESTQFNSRLQPTQIALGTVRNGTDKLKLNYDYGLTNNNGNVLSQQITVPTTGNAAGFIAAQNYTYDSLNRLKSANETISGGQTWKQTFIYDRYGNRNFDTANTTTLGGCPAAQCNPTIDISNNRFTTGQGYTFDLAGNVVTDAQGRSFNYDAENKQKSVSNSDGSLGTYFYDGDGKRVKKVVGMETTIFVYDAGGQLVAEYSTQIATTPQVSYLTQDNLGSPRINTDANGAVISRHDYYPFGEEIGRASYGGDEVRKQFTAYERDNELDLDFAQARYYNPKHGRFHSIDPYNIILESKVEKDAKKEREKLNVYLLKPQQWNRYIYVSNNPLIYTDPTGEILELTGSQDERDRTLAKLQELLGKDAPIGTITSGGRTFVIYNHDSYGLTDGAGNVGQVVEDLIDSKTTVELQITNKNVVTDALGTDIVLSDRGGGATQLISKDKIQIFINTNVVGDAGFNASLNGGEKVPITFSIAVAHELGHAYGAIKDGTYEVVTNKHNNRSTVDTAVEKNKQRSLDVENYQRDRLGLIHRNTHP